MSVVSLDDVKLALDIDLDDVSNDDELQDRLDEAESAYVAYVGPLTGSHTRRFHGGLTAIALPLGTTEVTAAAYDDGTAIAVDDLELDPETGILYLGYNTTGYFSAGRRNVAITYTVALPAHHKAQIIDDVAELWSRSQRGPNTGRPGFGGEGVESEPVRPVDSWPRIRRLAESLP